MSRTYNPGAAYELQRQAALLLERKLETELRRRITAWRRRGFDVVRLDDEVCVTMPEEEIRNELQSIEAG